MPASRRRPAVIAHRGGSGLAPENTLAAIRAAIDLEVDYVELDLRATRDGRLVLLHDRKVDRTTNGGGPLAELDFSDVRGLMAGQVSARIPTFDEALALCGSHVAIYLDHKAGPVADALDAIRRHRMESRIVVYGDPAILLEWRRLAPEVPAMPDVPGDERTPSGLASFIERFGPEVLEGSVTDWSADLVKLAHANGVQVFVDCLGDNDTGAAYQLAVELDVDGIQTDHPDRLLRYLPLHTLTSG